jgi:hypothetical protein
VENSITETPKNRYSYPLGPKVEEPSIPVGYIELQKAVEMLGQDMYPGEWTGEEREIIDWNTFGTEFRSTVERDTDREFRDAVLIAQCELECKLYGGDPELRYQIRSNFAKGYVPYVAMDELPPLSTVALKEIEDLFADKIGLAKAVRERREKVEDRLLRDMLWSGSLKAHYVALDGRLTQIETNIWGAVEGKNYFTYGELSMPGHFGKTCKRPVLILEFAVTAALNSSSMISGEEKLLDKMEILLKTDPSVRSINAASYAVVDKADGGGTTESKAKRLARKYGLTDRYNPRDPA